VAQAVSVDEQFLALLKAQTSLRSSQGPRFLGHARDEVVVIQLQHQRVLGQVGAVAEQMNHRVVGLCELFLAGRGFSIQDLRDVAALLDLRRDAGDDNAVGRRR